MASASRMRPGSGRAQAATVLSASIEVSPWAAARRELNVGGSVEEDGVVKQDAAGIGAGEPGDGFEEHGLTGSGAAIDGRHAGADREINVERKSRRDSADNANVGHGRVRPSCSRRLER